VHDTVFGNPETVGLEENTQFFVPVTDAESSTDPPAWGSAVGVAVNEVILGAEGFDLAGSREMVGTAFEA
jgi:hypothetical protein